MSKIAVFPGSFDPITKGHESVLLRALPLFDKIIVAVGVNNDKANFFSLEKRMELLKKVFGDIDKIELRTYNGLTINFCQEVGAKYLIRGLRTSADFEFERRIAQMNKMMFADIETVFLLTTPDLTAVHSTIVRDILKNDGDVSLFVPERIKHDLK